MTKESAVVPRPAAGYLHLGAHRVALVVLVLGLALVGALVAPAPRADAAQIGEFSANLEDGTGYIDYIDFTMVNTSSSPMMVLQHGADGGRRIRGNELYDHTVLLPGDYAEYAASGSANGNVDYRWSVVGTKYQVLFRSAREFEEASQEHEEHIYCAWYQNGDYSNAITDAPYTCAVDVHQGQYGHTTEYMTVADKDISALDAEHQASTLQMADKLCADSNNGNNYQVSCTFDEDLTGTAPKPIRGRGLPTVVARGQNCLTDRDAPLSTTKSTKVSNTVGWQETTKVSLTFKYTYAKIYEFAVSIEQSFAYSSSETTTSTDTHVYAATMKPLSAAEITVVYNVLRLSRNMHVKVAHTEFDLKGITITIREPDTIGASSANPLPPDC